MSKIERRQNMTTPDISIQKVDKIKRGQGEDAYGSVIASNFGANNSVFSASENNKVRQADVSRISNILSGTA